MKGFYFSLDALTASMVLMATVAMISSYDQGPSTNNQPVQLDNLHAASMQQSSDWNNSIDSGNSVLGRIYTQYFEQPAKAKQTCQNYFNQSQDYALYLVNSTSQEKICGDYTVSQQSNTAVEQSLAPDLPVNSDFRGPYKVVMVMPN
jgi:hypothetical protein